MEGIERIKALVSQLEDRNREIEKRDWEIEKLRHANEELLAELRRAQTAVGQLTSRVQASDDSLTLMQQQLTDIVEKDLHVTSTEIIRVTSLNEKLSRRVNDLQQHLEEVTWQTKGVYPYLGLHVTEDEKGVRVLKLRDPAASAGMLAGDIMKRIKIEKEYPMVSVESFQRCLTELLPECQVSVTVLRNGRDLRDVTLRPGLSTDRPKH